MFYVVTSMKITKMDKLSLNPKQRNQDKNIKVKVKKHKVCKTKEYTNLYYDQIRKHKHKKNITRL